MKILVIGNISSGKSTVVTLLSQLLSNFQTISIDSTRKKFGDGTEKAESM